MHGLPAGHLWYRDVPKFLDRQVWANSADPDQTAPRGAVWSVSTMFAIPSAGIVWTHNSMLEPHSSNFRVITMNVLGVRTFRNFTVDYKIVVAAV